VPAAVVPQLVDDCVAKGVRSIHFFTAGFSETGDADRADLERQVLGKLKAAGIRVIGPNCMGLYVPGVGLAFMGQFPKEAGNVFLLSQSGANAGDIVGGLARRGVRFSKVVSYGNGADLDAQDFLDYAAWDPQTEVVTAYIEGVKNGRAVFEALKRCAAVKPTIVLKGGLSAAGARAANSHTGSLAGSVDVFEAACRQAGAIRAENMDELHDLVVAMTTDLRRVRGRGVALVGGGGGFAVLSADAIAANGLDTPPLPEETQERLREFIPIAGTSVRNPVDTNMMGGPDGRRRMRDTLTLVGKSAPIDTVLATVGGWDDWRPQAPSDDGAPADPPVAGGDSEPAMQGSSGSRAERAREAAGDLGALQGIVGKPFVAVQRERGSSGDRDSTRAFLDEAYFQGVAVFPTVHRAAKTIGRLLEWRERRDGLPSIF
jgi:acyl-CoA synthetase (NDP forming)